MKKCFSDIAQRFVAHLPASIFLVLGLMSSLPAFGNDHLNPGKSHIVFLISEDPDNYEAHKTIPAFAEMLERDYNFKVTVLLGEGPREAYSFPNIDAVSKADLLVVFCRRLALPLQQLAVIRNYLKAGKPLIGLRTANHAFSFRETPREGHEAWWEFVPDVLGCENRGYGSVEAGTDVTVVEGGGDHPILKDVPPEWHSTGNLYLVAPMLDHNATILLMGTADNKTEPIAWTRMTADKSKVFYTSLGYPDDFQQEPFRKLLLNGIQWALKR